ncbi:MULTISPECIES: DUF6188 family protein [unclassified Nocardia]|uniref:DUF6188 family protein n=1 Tax=unclassified Nocardia TaxID=2637762 RepID=UPI0033ABE82F
MIELQIQGTVVKEILVGYTITLRSGTSASEYELQIECELSLSDPAGFTKVAPEEYSLIESRLGSLVGATVISACSDDNGELIMKFSNDVMISVPVDQDFEAWGIAGPGGYRVISSPGGGVARWSERP